MCPIKNASKLEHVRFGTCPILNASDPERFWSGTCPIRNASEPEPVQSGTRPIRNVSDPKRVQSRTCPIQNASNPERVRSRTPLPGTHPDWATEATSKVGGLRTDHVISGPIRGLKINYMARGHTNIQTDIATTRLTRPCCENLIYGNLCLLNLSLKTTWCLSSPVPKPTWKLEYTWAEKCSKMKIKGSCE